MKFQWVLKLVFIGTTAYFFVYKILKITAISRNTGLRFNSLKLVTGHLRLLDSLAKKSKTSSYDVFANQLFGT